MFTRWRKHETNLEHTSCTCIFNTFAWFLLHRVNTLLRGVLTARVNARDARWRAQWERTFRHLIARYVIVKQKAKMFDVTSKNRQRDIKLHRKRLKVEKNYHVFKTFLLNRLQYGTKFATCRSLYCEIRRNNTCCDNTNAKWLLFDVTIWLLIWATSECRGLCHKIAARFYKVQYKHNSKTKCGGLSAQFFEVCFWQKLTKSDKI